MASRIKCRWAGITYVEHTESRTTAKAPVLASDAGPRPPVGPPLPRPQSPLTAGEETTTAPRALTPTGWAAAASAFTCCARPSSATPTVAEPRSMRFANSLATPASGRPSLLGPRGGKFRSGSTPVAERCAPDARNVTDLGELTSGFTRKKHKARKTWTCLLHFEFCLTAPNQKSAFSRLVVPCLRRPRL